MLVGNKTDLADKRYACARESMEALWLSGPHFLTLLWLSCPEVKGTARLGSTHRNTDRPVRPHTLRQASHLKVPSSLIQQRQARDLSAQMLPLWSQDSL